MKTETQDVKFFVGVSGLDDLIERMHEEGYKTVRWASRVRGIWFVTAEK